MKIKGYKASYNGVCKRHKYEVGKTYTIDNIKMCERGFHFCIEMKDVLKYYNYKKDFIIFEVNGSGEMITDGNKTVCSQIEIIRIVPQEEYTFQIPLYEYDQNRNVIHYKGSSGYEYWNTYDENNNVIHHKDSTGYKFWKTYDENNKLIYYKNSNGINYTF